MEKDHRKISTKKLVLKVIAMTFGAILAGIGLELFLVPNDVTDGGITGISVMLSHISDLPVGAFILTLNIPFLIIGYKIIGRTFTLLALYGIIVFSLSTSYLHNSEAFTNDILLAAVFGGIILGAGVGIGIRAGGSLDGIEILSLVVSKKFPFSVGEFVLFFNLFILFAAGFVFSWESAMYSFIAFFIAFKVIDLVLVGLDESRSLIIVTNKPDEIGNAIMEEMNCSVTYLEGTGSYSKDVKKIVYCVITRLEETKIKELLEEYDPEAFMTISNVSEARGGRFGRGSH